MLFNDIAAELKYLVDAGEKPAGTTTCGSAFSLVSGGLGGGLSGSGATGPLVFRLHSIKTTQAREYFTMLGQIIRHPEGQQLMDETDIFRNLSMIGCHPQLDYLSRVVITALAFHDNGFMSKHLIRIWTSGTPGTSHGRGGGSGAPLLLLIPPRVSTGWGRCWQGCTCKRYACPQCLSTQLPANHRERERALLPGVTQYHL